MPTAKAKAKGADALADCTGKNGEARGFSSTVGSAAAPARKFVAPRCPSSVSWRRSFASGVVGLGVTAVLFGCGPSGTGAGAGSGQESYGESSDEPGSGDGDDDGSFKPRRDVGSTSDDGTTGDHGEPPERTCAERLEACEDALANGEIGVVCDCSYASGCARSACFAACDRDDTLILAGCVGAQCASEVGLDYTAECIVDELACWNAAGDQWCEPLCSFKHDRCRGRTTCEAFEVQVPIEADCRLSFLVSLPSEIQHLELEADHGYLYPVGVGEDCPDDATGYRWPEGFWGSSIELCPGTCAALPDPKTVTVYLNSGVICE